MFESLVSGLLTKYLGEYVKNIDPKQLSISVFGGDVVLNDLELKKEALDALNLPITVKSGFIGKLVLHANWKNLGGEPVIAELDRIYLVATSKASQKYDARAENESEQAAKQSQLSALETQKEAALKSDAPVDDSFTTRLIAKVVDNLQVNINRIHVRYEGIVPGTTRPYATGFTLESLKAFSTDSDWSPAFLSGTSMLVHKIVELQNMAVYWDLDTPALADMPIQRMADELGRLIASRDHQYIIKPISANAKAIINNNPKPDMNQPKFLINLDIQEIGFRLEDSQFGELTQLGEEFALYNRSYQWRKYRPTVPITGNAKVWWGFLRNCTLHDIHEKALKWTPRFFAQRRTDRKAYIDLWKKFKKSTDGKMVDDDKKALAALEATYSFADLKFFRSLAEAEVKIDAAVKRQEEKKKKDEGGGGWFGGWFGGGKKTEEAAGTPKENAVALTDEQRKFFYQTIGYSADEKPADLPLEYTKMKVNFTLRAMSFALAASAPSGTRGLASELALLAFEGLGVEFWQRPDSMKVNMQLDKLEFHDKATSGTQYPVMVYKKQRAEESSTNLLALANSALKGKAAGEAEDKLLEVMFEQNPLDRHASTVVSVVLQPLNVVYNPQLIDRVMKFFDTGKNVVATQDLSRAYAAQVASLQAATRANLQYQLEQRATMDLRADIFAPHILVPESVTAADCSMVIVDLGRLLVNSDLSQIKKAKPGEVPSEMEAYDTLRIQLHSAQVLVARTSEGWRAAQTHHVTPMHLVEKFDINMTLSNSAVPDNADFAKTKISGTLPAMRVHASTNKLRDVMRIVTAITAKPATDAQTALEAGGGQPTVSLPEDRTVSVDMSKELEKAQRDKKELEETDLSILEKRENLVVSFTIEEISVTVTDDYKQEPQALVKLSLSGFTTNVIMRAFDMDVNVALTSFDIEDLMQQYSKDYQFLVRSDVDRKSADQTANKLFLIKYLWADKMSPIFVSKKQCTEQVIHLQFNALHVLVNPDTIRAVLAFQYKAFPPAPAAPAQKAVVRAVNVPESSELHVRSSHSKANSRAGSRAGSIADRAMSAARTFSVSRRATGAEGRGRAPSVAPWLAAPDAAARTEEKWRQQQAKIQNKLNAQEQMAKRKMAGGGALKVGAAQKVGAAGEPAAAGPLATTSGVRDASPAAAPAAAPAAPLELINLKVSAQIKEISLTLSRGGKQIVGVAMGALNTSMVQKPTNILVHGTLGYLNVVDLPAEKKLYASIVAVQGDKFVDFKYETYDPNKDPDCDAYVWLRINRLNVYFVNAFVTKLLNWNTVTLAYMLEPMSAAPEAPATPAGAETPGEGDTAADAEDDAEAGPSGTAATDLPTIVEDPDFVPPALQPVAARFKLDVKIRAPNIIMPRHSKSTEQLVLDMGELEASNTFRRQDGVVLDDMMVRLTAFTLTIVDTTKPAVFNRNVIAPFSFKVNILRSLQTALTQVPALSIIGDLPSFSIIISQKDYALFLALSSENLAEQPDDMAPVPATPAPAPKADKEKDKDADKSAVTRTTSLASVERYKTMVVKMTFARLSLTLFMPSREDPNVFEPLAGLTFSDMALDYTTYSDNAMTAVVGLGGMRIMDQRKEVKDTKLERFREILTPVNSTGQQIHVNYTMEGNKNQIIDVVMESTTGHLDFPAVYAIQNFFILPAAPAAPKAIEPAKEEDPDAVEGSGVGKDTPAAPAKAAKEPMPTMKVTAKIRNTSFQLLETGKTTNIRAFTLGLAVDALYETDPLGGMLVDAKIKGMSLHKCMADTPKIAEPIFEEFNVKALYKTTPATDISLFRTEIDAKIDPLDVRISYQDVKLVTAIVATMTPPKAPEPEKPKETLAIEGAPPTPGAATPGPSSARGKEAAPEEDTEDFDDTSSYTTLNDDTFSMVDSSVADEGQWKPVAEGQQEVVLKTSEEQVTLTLGSMRVVLVNDQKVAQATPVVDIRMADMEIVVRDYASNLATQLLLRLSMDYYNPKLASWEPMIEPWIATISVNMTAKPYSMRADIISDQFLNINVTHTFVETMYLLSYILSADLYSLNNDKAEDAFVPYRIVNMTGQKMRFWLAVDKQVNLAAFESANVDFRGIVAVANTDLGADEALQRQHVIALQLAPKWDALKQINIDRVGTRAYNLTPEVGHLHRVIIDVRLEKDTKNVYVHSAVSLHNASKIPIEVCLEDERPNMPARVLPPIAAGAYGSVPILACVDARLRVRPAGRDVGWSEQMWSWRDNTAKKDAQLSAKDRTLLWQCPRTDPTIPRFVMGAKIELQDYPGAKFAYPHHKLTFFTPVELVNACPVPLGFTLARKEFPDTPEETIATGKSALLYDISPNDAVNIRVSLAGFTCEKDAALFTHNGGPGKEIVLVDAREKSRKLRLQILHVTAPDGTRKASIYCPYWLINHSDQPLVYGQGRAMDATEVAAGSPDGGRVLPSDVPFMFSWPHDGLLKNKLSIVVNTSEWSKPFSIETAGFTGVVEAADELSKKLYQIGVGITLGKGAYSMVRMVTFTARFMFVSHLDTPIRCIQDEVDDGEATELLLNPLIRTPFHWPQKDKKKNLRVTFRDGGWSMSCPFSLTDVGIYAVKLEQRAEGDEPGEMVETYLMRVEVKQADSITYILFAEDTQITPFRIHNKTTMPITYQQLKVDRKREVARDDTVDYAWDELLGKQTLVLTFPNNQSTELAITEIHEFENVTVGDMKLAVEVTAEGPTRVMTIVDLGRSDMRVPRKGAKALKSIFKKLRREAAGKPERKHKDDRPQTNLMTVRVGMAGLAISVIDKHPRELLYVTLGGIDVEFSNSDQDMSLELLLLNLQIDNQTIGAKFPVLLGRRNLDSAELAKHIFHFSVAKDNTKKTIDFYNYMGVQLLEINLKVEEALVSNILDFVYSMPSAPAPAPAAQAQPPALAAAEAARDAREGKTDADRLPAAVPQELVDHPVGNDGTVRIVAVDAEIAVSTTETRQLYFETLHINPVVIGVTFESSPGTEGEALIASFPIIRALGVTLANIDDATLKLNALLFTNLFVTQGELVSRITHHYTIEGIKESYKVLGSFEFLGNPVGLFSNISSGVADFFYEPAKGIVESPRAFGRGVAKGTKSLVTNTIYGLFNTASKITGTIGKGLGALSMDDEYIDRREHAAHNKPKHAGEGLVMGVQALGRGIFDGVTGLVMSPVRGAREGGAAGFFKGVGKGLIGVVVKPTAGVLDLATKTTEGIRNTARLFDTKAARVRTPRFIGPDKVVKVFDKESALGQDVLYSVRDGRYIHRTYFINSAPLAESEHKILLLSSGHIMVANVKKESAEWTRALRALEQWEVVDSTLMMRFHKSSRPQDLLRASEHKIVLESAEVAAVFWSRLSMAIELADAAEDEEDETPPQPSASDNGGGVGGSDVAGPSGAPSRPLDPQAVQVSGANSING